MHDLGLVVVGVFAIAAIAGLVEMGRRLAGRSRSEGGTHASPASVADAVWYAVARESVGHVRMRQECADDPAAGQRPWFRQRWFIHASTMWGFLGLLAATLLDWVLALTGVKATGTAVPIW